MIKKGELFTNNAGHAAKVTKYVSSREVHIEFVNTSFKTVVQVSNMRNGRFKDRSIPTVYGVGYMGKGTYKASSAGADTKVYKTWHGMLERCYDTKYHDKYPTYIGCSVATEWQNFQYFAEWYFDNYPVVSIDTKYHLDKDVLVQGNKLYSKNTCCFLPEHLNMLLTYDKSDKGCLPTGVVNYKTTGKYLVQMSCSSTTIGLGVYESIEEAEEAYKCAKYGNIEREAKESYNKGEISKEIYTALISHKIT